MGHQTNKQAAPSYARGFTLIELMIVVAIIAILTAIGISVYQESIAKSELSEALTISDGLKTSVAEYDHQVGSCPAAGDGGILTPASYGGKYVASASVSGSSGNCVITTLMRSNTVAQKLRGKKVVFTMTANSGTAEWKCTSDAPVSYLPQVCR
jgi:type IV pilus assembly protein PilA